MFRRIAIAVMLVVGVVTLVGTFAVRLPDKAAGVDRLTQSLAGDFRPAVRTQIANDAAIVGAMSDQLRA
jgi:hypothetical protein